MRIGAAFFVLLASFAAGTSGASGAGAEGPPDSSRARMPRGPYLLRQIFGDSPRSAPEVLGVAPGIRRGDLPADADLGKEVGGSGSPTAFLKEISGRATVSFVFDGPGGEARLDHITVTVLQAPNITSKAVLLHLTKIYGPEDPGFDGESGEILGSWQGGMVLLRHFSTVSFFEVILGSPHPKPLSREDPDANRHPESPAVFAHSREPEIPRGARRY